MEEISGREGEGNAGVGEGEGMTEGKVGVVCACVRACAEVISMGGWLDHIASCPSFHAVGGAQWWDRLGETEDKEGDGDRKEGDKRWVVVV